MKKGFKRLLTGTGVVAAVTAAATAATYILTRKLVTVALDREEPKTIGKSKELLTGNANIEQVLEMQQEIAVKLETADCEVVEITAQDGTKLVGHLHRAEQAKRTVIAMHGWRSSWAKDFGMLADFLFDNRCNVLFAEQRGQGQSGGEYMGFGLTERFDCLDWITWACEQSFSDLPIYLAGISMGATTVLMTAGFALPQQVHGIFADCGFTAPEEIWRHVAKNMHVLYDGLCGSLASALFKKKINVEVDSYSTLEAMADCKVPVLFIHGTDDAFVPIEMTYENYKACAAQKRLLVVPGAEHGMSYVVDKEGYEAAVKDFWREFD